MTKRNILMLLGLLFPVTVTALEMPLDQPAQPVAVPEAVPLNQRLQPPIVEKLKGHELVQLFANSRITGNDGSYNYVQTLQGNGEMQGEAVPVGGGWKRTDFGRWWVSADRICMQYRLWRNGREFCRDVERVTAGGYRYVGDHSFTLAKTQ